MEPPNSAKRRSSARLSSGNARRSHSDSLRIATLSRSNMTPQPGLSAQATPNNSFNIGSGFSSANNTIGGIAKARAQFHREHQETPRTALLALGQIPSANHVLNPHDQITTVNADAHFHTRALANVNEKQDIKNATKKRKSGLKSPDVSNSSADFEETLRIRSIAEESFSASGKKRNAKEFQLRRTSRKSNPLSYKNIQESSQSETDAEMNKSVDINISDIPEPDIENKENNYTSAERPVVELKRRLSRKSKETFSKNKGSLTDKIDGNDGQNTSLEHLTNNQSKSLKQSTTIISDIDMSEDSINVDSTQPPPKIDILSRRTRSTRNQMPIAESPKNTDLTTVNDLSRGVDEGSISDISKTFNEPSVKKLLRRNRKTISSIPDLPGNKVNIEPMQTQRDSMSRSNKSMSQLDPDSLMSSSVDKTQGPIQNQIDPVRLLRRRKDIYEKSSNKYQNDYNKIMMKVDITDGSVNNSKTGRSVTASREISVRENSDVQNENTERLELTAGSIDKTHGARQKNIDLVQLQKRKTDIRDKGLREFEENYKKIMMNVDITDGSVNSSKRDRTVTAAREKSREENSGVLNETTVRMELIAGAVDKTQRTLQNTSVEGSDDVQNENTERLEFLPNIESTRLAPNARDELSNDDIGSEAAGKSRIKNFNE